MSTGHHSSYNFGMQIKPAGGRGNDGRQHELSFSFLCSFALFLFEGIVLRQTGGSLLTIVVLWGTKLLLLLLLLLHVQLGGTVDGAHVVGWRLSQVHAQHLVGIAVGSPHHDVVAAAVVVATAGGGGETHVGAAAAEVHGTFVAHTHVEGARDEQIRKAQCHQWQHQQRHGQKQIVGPFIAQRAGGPLLTALAQACRRGRRSRVEQRVL